MFRSAGSSQPAGRHYSVFGHLLNRASRTLPPIMSCHYVGRVISHQFLSVVFFTGTIPYLSVPVLETLRFLKNNGLLVFVSRNGYSVLSTEL